MFAIFQSIVSTIVLHFFISSFWWYYSSSINSLWILKNSSIFSNFRAIFRKIRSAIGIFLNCWKKYFVIQKPIDKSFLYAKYLNFFLITSKFCNKLLWNLLVWWKVDRSNTGIHQIVHNSFFPGTFLFFEYVFFLKMLC